MFRLAHISDLHLGPLPKMRRRDLASKRLTGYINWRRGRAQRDESQALGLLIADMRAREPDHIAITGDLTNLALAAEIDAAAAWLETLGPSRDVSVIPGNHDAYVPGALRLACRAWAPWMRGDDPVRSDPGDEEPASFPYVRRRGPVALIGVSSAVATAPFWATGRVGRRQTSEMADILEQTGKEGLFRIVMVHHPPVPVSAGTVTRHLVDGHRFRKALGKAGAELVLHGHDHVRQLHHVTKGGRPIPLVGVPAGAGFHKHGKPVREGRAAGYALHEIETEGNGFALTVIHRAFSAAGHIVETERFAMRLPGAG